MNWFNATLFSDGETYMINNANPHTCVLIMPLIDAGNLVWCLRAYSLCHFCLLPLFIKILTIRLTFVVLKGTVVTEVRKNYAVSCQLAKTVPLKKAREAASYTCQQST